MNDEEKDKALADFIKGWVRSEPKPIRQNIAHSVERAEQVAKAYAELHKVATELYGLKTNLLFRIDSVRWSLNGGSGESHYNRLTDTIVIVGKFSLLTYLHELAHARFGSNQVRATEWSQGIFRRALPKTYDRLVSVSGLMVKGGEAYADNNQPA